MPPYERIKAWEHCHRLVLEVYRITRSWPTDERFGLTAQTRRAAVSTAANIVEGSSKRGPREFRRFLDIANGSLAEVGYLLRVGKDLEVLPEQSWVALERMRDEAARTLWGLYAAIGRKAAKGSRKA